MFKNAVVGDRVWSIRKGWGTVIKVDTDSDYPIKVRLDVSERIEGYTYDGRFTSVDLGPELFWDEVHIVAPSKPKVKRSYEEVKWCNIYPKGVSTGFGILNNKYFFGCLGNNPETVKENSLSRAVALAKVVFTFEVEE